MGWMENGRMTRAGATGVSANKVVLLRDGDGDGMAELRKTILDGLDSPSGMGWHDGTLYVANHNALLSFPYALGDDTVAGAAKKLMDIPAGGNHWMRNIALSPDGKRIYVAAGADRSEERWGGKACDSTVRSR